MQINIRMEIKVLQELRPIRMFFSSHLAALWSHFTNNACLFLRRFGYRMFVSKSLTESVKWDFGMKYLKFYRCTNYFTLTKCYLKVSVRMEWTICIIKMLGNNRDLTVFGVICLFQVLSQNEPEFKHRNDHGSYSIVSIRSYSYLAPRSLETLML